jgi:hypothetical protein
MMAGGAMASAQNFLNWAGQRTARVMYLDGDAAQFAPVIVRPGNGWEVTPTRPSSKTRAQGRLDPLEYLNAYDRLADGIVESAGFDGKPVRKVKSDAVRDELKSRGFLLLDERATSPLTAASSSRTPRSNCSKAGDWWKVTGLYGGHRNAPEREGGT